MLSYCRISDENFNEEMATDGNFIVLPPGRVP